MNILQEKLSLSRRIALALALALAFDVNYFLRQYIMTYDVSM